MTEEMDKKIDLAIYSEITPVSGVEGVQLIEAIARMRNKVRTIVKEALPELAKEAGYFQEEADWIGSLLKKGWIPPAENLIGQCQAYEQAAYDKGYAKAVKDSQELIGKRELFWTQKIEQIFEEIEKESPHEDSLNHYCPQCDQTIIGLTEREWSSLKARWLGRRKA